MDLAEPLAIAAEIAGETRGARGRPGELLRELPKKCRKVQRKGAFGSPCSSSPSTPPSTPSFLGSFSGSFRSNVGEFGLGAL